MHPRPSKDQVLYDLTFEFVYRWHPPLNVRQSKSTLADPPVGRPSSHCVLSAGFPSNQRILVLAFSAPRTRKIRDPADQRVTLLRNADQRTAAPDNSSHGFILQRQPDSVSPGNSRACRFAKERRWLRPGAIRRASFGRSRNRRLSSHPAPSAVFPPRRLENRPR